MIWTIWTTSFTNRDYYDLLCASMIRYGASVRQSPRFLEPVKLVGFQLLVAVQPVKPDKAVEAVEAHLNGKDSSLLPRRDTGDTGIPYCRTRIAEHKCGTSLAQDCLTQAHNIGQNINRESTV